MGFLCNRAILECYRRQYGSFITNMMWQFAKHDDSGSDPSSESGSESGSGSDSGSDPDITTEYNNAICKGAQLLDLLNLGHNNPSPLTSYDVFQQPGISVDTIREVDPVLITTYFGTAFNALGIETSGFLSWQGSVCATTTLKNFVPLSTVLTELRLVHWIEC